VLEADERGAQLSFTTEPEGEVPPGDEAGSAPVPTGEPEAETPAVSGTGPAARAGAGDDDAGGGALPSGSDAPAAEQTVPLEVSGTAPPAGAAETSTEDVVPTDEGQIEYPREGLPGAEPVATVSSGEGTELPHWADPPTGEVPRALAGQREDEEMQGWRLLGSRGLHWRDDVNDWSNGPGVEDLVDETDDPVTPPPVNKGGPFSFDEEFERLERERGRRGGAGPEGSSYAGLEHSGEGQPPAGLVGSGQASSAGPGGAAAIGRTAATTEVVGVPPGLGGGMLASAGPAPDAGGQVSRTGRSGRRGAPGRRRAGATASAGPSPAGSASGEVREAASVGAVRAPGRPYDMGAETTGPGPGGRDVGVAVATGAGLVVVFVVCYLIGPVALVVLSTVGILGCALEAFSMLQRAGFRPATLVGALGSGGAVLAAYWRGTTSLPVLMVVVLAASLVWYLGRVVEARPVVNSAVTLLGFAWVGLLGSFAGLLLQAPYGRHLFLSAVVTTVVADIAAWFAGSQFGSHPLAPHTSPGKTWEGFIAGGIAALVTGAVIGRYLSPWGGLLHGLELGLVVAIVAPVGDLVQSMVKRDLRLKDSGAFLPGHGGLLDRFDSLLFVLPATYFLVAVLHL